VICWGRYFSSAQKRKHGVSHVCLSVSAQGGVSNSYDGLVTEHHQQEQIRRDDVNWATNDQPQHQTINQSTVGVPTAALDMATYQSSDSVEAANSFHSASSADSLAEMNKYFPNAQTPAASPFR
jgi:hypothetical protein